MNMLVTWATAAMLLAGCGGGKQATRGDGVGDTHANQDGDEVPLAGDGTAGGDAGPGEAELPDAGAPPPAVIFRIVNSGADELSFNMNKGWQPVIFAWSGERGKGAKPIIMFDKFCTASCDLGEEEVCPYCPPPENNKAAREAQKYEHVAAGGSLDVPWDGLAYTYEKTRGLQEGKKKKCECWRKAEPPPEEYTVMACGQRLTDQANVHSAHQCVEAKMTLPPTETPMVVTFDFPKPDTGKKKKRGR